MKKKPLKKSDQNFEEIKGMLEGMYKSRSSKKRRILAYNLCHLLLEVEVMGRAFVNAPPSKALEALWTNIDTADIYLSVLKSLCQKDPEQVDQFVKDLPNSLLGDVSDKGV